MNPVVINFELCQEDRARLDKVIDLLEQADWTKIRPVKDENPFTEATTPEAEKSPAEAKNEPQAVPAEEPKQPDVSIEEVRRLVINLIQKGKRPAVEALVKKYAASVSTIPADKRDDVFLELTKLED